MANSFRPSEGSLWQRRFAASKQRHPGSFSCGVRVREGRIRGESGRWRYKQSWVDRLRSAGDEVTLHHGDKVVLRLRVDRESLSGGGGRPGEFTLLAVEQSTGALVQLSVQGFELHRFGIED